VIRKGSAVSVFILSKREAERAVKHWQQLGRLAKRQGKAQKDNGY
jgi:hypothetical protein